MNLPPDVAIAFDWDGVITRSPSWTPVYADVELAPIREAIRRGHPVAIMTCSPLDQVAAELERHGLRAFADHKLQHCQWQVCDLILITHRKIWDAFYVDDRAVNYQHGDPVQRLFSDLAWAVARVESRRHI